MNEQGNPPCKPNAVEWRALEGLGQATQAGVQRPSAAWARDDCTASTDKRPIRMKWWQCHSQQPPDHERAAEGNCDHDRRAADRQRGRVFATRQDRAHLGHRRTQPRRDRHDPSVARPSSLLPANAATRCTHRHLTDQAAARSTITVDLGLRRYRHLGKFICDKGQVRQDL